MSLLKKLNYKNVLIKKGLTIFLQIVVVLTALTSIFLLLLAPTIEGRNVNATIFQIYFNDPFLAYIYLSSISFFAVLYQAYKLLGYVRGNKLFKQAGVKTLRNIKYYAGLFAILIFLADAFIFIKFHFMGGKDDPAGGLAVGAFVIFVSIIVATIATIFEKLLQKAVKMKEENDLTV